MYDSSPQNLRKAQEFAVRFLTDIGERAAEIGKPLFLEEFGMARDNWENKGKEYSYLKSANTTHRDAYFEVTPILKLCFFTHRILNSFRLHI